MAELKARPKPATSTCEETGKPCSAEPASSTGSTSISGKGIPASLPAIDTPTDARSSLMRGRNGYTRPSSLRTKPGRPDSFPAISLSCSDKICSWSVLGLQGALISNMRFSVPLSSVQSEHGDACREMEEKSVSDDGLADGHVISATLSGRATGDEMEVRFDPIYLDGIVIGDVQPPSIEAEDTLVGWKPPSGGQVQLRSDWTPEERVESFREAVRAEAEWALFGRVEHISGKSSSQVISPS